jgi:isoleucyl-tRNA synthetase
MDPATANHLNEMLCERKRRDEAALAAALAEHNRVRKPAEDLIKLCQEQVQRLYEQEEERFLRALLRETAEGAAQLARKRHLEKRERALVALREAVELRKREEAELQRKGLEIARQEDVLARQLEAQTGQAEEERRRAEQAAVKARATAAAAEAQQQQEQLKQAEEEEKRKQTALKAEQQQQQQLQLQQQQQQQLAKEQKPAVNAKQEDTGKDPLHPAFLEIHQRLKQLRKNVLDLTKQDRALKTVVGDTRREIRKCIGQLVTGKGANKIPVRRKPPLSFLSAYLLWPMWAPSYITPSPSSFFFLSFRIE